MLIGNNSSGSAVIYISLMSPVLFSSFAFLRARNLSRLPWNGLPFFKFLFFLFVGFAHLVRYATTKIIKVNKSPFGQTNRRHRAETQTPYSEPLKPLQQYEKRATIY